VNNLGAHLIITGIALNVAAAAGTTLGLFFATGDKGMSGALKSGVLPNVKLPGIDAIPVLGTILSGHHILTYVALIAVPLVSMMMARTPACISAPSASTRNRRRPQASRWRASR
jgi:simple sugar transport system permease protein